MKSKGIIVIDDAMTQSEVQKVIGEYNGFERTEDKNVVTGYSCEICTDVGPVSEIWAPFISTMAVYSEYQTNKLNYFLTTQQIHILDEGQEVKRHFDDGLLYEIDGEGYTLLASCVVFGTTGIDEDGALIFPWCDEIIPAVQGRAVISPCSPYHVHEVLPVKSLRVSLVSFMITKLTDFVE